MLNALKGLNVENKTQKWLKDYRRHKRCKYPKKNWFIDPVLIDSGLNQAN